jgi:hypothetical protein
VVDVLRLGVSLGVQTLTWMPAGDDNTFLVSRDNIKDAVSKLLGEEEEAKEMRRKVCGDGREGEKGNGRGRFVI